MSVNDFRMYVMSRFSSLKSSISSRSTRRRTCLPKLTPHASFFASFASSLGLNHCARSFRGDAAFENFETLLRSVLAYPSKPAVIILQTFKLDGIIATGGDSQLSLAEYYDVP